KHHQVSRMTVNKAINELVQDNYLYREHGRGTFVANNITSTVISPLSSFTSEMNKQGKSPLTKLRDWKEIGASGNIARNLEISAKEKVIKMERLRIIENKPFIWEQVHIPLKKCPDLTQKDVKNNSLYQILENKYYFNLNYAEATVEPILLNNKISNLLKVGENTMGLLFYQTTYLDNGEPIEYTKAYYQSEQYKFKFKFGANIN
ncbi:MAG: GntR family transcriptional regulator, partial [bacterium]